MQRRGPLAPVIEQLLGHLGSAGGYNVMTSCPFHTRNGQKEAHPSFAIRTDNGLWFCHSCKTFGNFRSLLKRMGVSGGGMTAYLENVEAILQATTPEEPGNPTWIKPVDSRYALPEQTLGLFDFAPRQMILWGYQKRVLRQFNVGYDTKHDRITFPLRDYTGQLVGFSGRAARDGMNPRFKFYTKPEYDAWGVSATGFEDKGHLIWNYDQVRASSAHTDTPVIVVEGFKACLWLYQCGWTSIVALMGSSMSYTQQRLLERLGSKLYLMLDNDSGGQHKYEMAERLSQSCRVFIPEYPTRQPDTLAPEQITEAIDKAPSYLTWTSRKPLGQPDLVKAYLRKIKNDSKNNS